MVNREEGKNMEIFDVLNEYGEFTGKTATREECHKKGYWHRAVYAFIIDNNYEGLTDKTGPWNFLKKILEEYAV